MPLGSHDRRTIPRYGAITLEHTIAHRTEDLAPIELENGGGFLGQLSARKIDQILIGHLSQNQAEGLYTAVLTSTHIHIQRHVLAVGESPSLNSFPMLTGQVMKLAAANSQHRPQGAMPVGYLPSLNILVILVENHCRATPQVGTDSRKLLNIHGHRAM